MSTAQERVTASSAALEACAPNGTYIWWVIHIWSRQSPTEQWKLIGTEVAKARTQMIAFSLGMIEALHASAGYRFAYNVHGYDESGKRWRMCTEQVVE